MRKLIPFILVMSMIVGAVGLQANPSKDKVTYFSPSSFYIYGMVGYTYFSPLQEYTWGLGFVNTNSFTPTIGLGYQIIKFGRRSSLSLEFDYSRSNFDFNYYAQDQPLHTFVFALSGDFLISRRFPLSVFASVGVGLFNLSDLDYVDINGDSYGSGNDKITTLMLAFGAKIPFSRNVVFRAECRLHNEVYSDDDYYYDYYYWGNDPLDFEFVSSSFSAGLEIHF